MNTASEAISFWTLLCHELNLPPDTPRNEIVSKYLGHETTTWGDLLIQQIQAQGHVNRILVIGQTGVGKSSLINLLAGEHVTNDSDSAVGCTFDHVTVRIVHDGQIIELIDTVGLNENSKGTVTDEQAIEKLFEFIRSNQRGFNLLLFVMKKGRLNEMFETNFELFSSVVSSGRIPAVLFISQCESDDPMNIWLKDYTNQQMINRFHFAEVVCGTTKAGGRFGEKLRPLREETKNAVWKSIITKMSKKPIQIGDSRQLIEKIKDMWSNFWRPNPTYPDGLRRATRSENVTTPHTNVIWSWILSIYKLFFPDPQQPRTRDVADGYVDVETWK
ncbi:unnamed protein product [Adineta steineri]|uniref:G domain-containing protein n=1 Tax=Adineta steineri TaxID=433720 RepID=A0A815D4V2_9BILA|nr:unnamed protein product [Adineta steineri]CAF1570655.1 unnamed protein product [Adineta steineri]